MTTGLSIKQVADASGFTPAALRYYEQIGVLPEPARTAAGYRRYDPPTLDRLAFIARAKQLGCRLDEIADLATAWEGGECGPIQTQLRRLVAAKREATAQQIAELSTLAAELHRAATALERHRPEGACDDGCGCVGDPAGPGTIPARPVLFSAAPPAPAEPVIACTLGVDALPARLDDWAALLGHVARRTPIDDGVHVAFDAEVPVDELMRLVAAGAQISTTAASPTLAATVNPSLRSSPATMASPAYTASAVVRSASRP